MHDPATGSATTWLPVGIVIVVLLALGLAYRKRLEDWLLWSPGDGPVDERKQR